MAVMAVATSRKDSTNQEVKKYRATFVTIGQQMVPVFYFTQSEMSFAGRILILTVNNDAKFLQKKQHIPYISKKKKVGRSGEVMMGHSM